MKPMLCEWCGWLLKHCPCQPDTPESRAVVEARHAAAVRLAASRPVALAWSRPNPTIWQAAQMQQRRGA